MTVAVVGGGPAGMMAAIAAASNGADVTLFEKNEKLGKKMYISGKGRCNITNACSATEFLDNVVVNRKFLFGAINRFSPQSTQDFCTSHRLPIKVERGNRVFPQSDKSSDVIKMFAKQLDELGVKVRLNTQISAVLCQENGISLNTISDIVSFDRVIIATGGLSYSATGSTGDGYVFAKSLGHSIVEPRPALCRILCDGTASLEGLSLKNVTVGVFCNGRMVDQEFGEMLFADNGVGGPAVLTLSSRINRKELHGAEVRIDLKPALSAEKLDMRILRDFSQEPNKNFINSLGKLLPERLIKQVARQSGIPFDKKVNQITAAERQRLVSALKGLSFPFRSLDTVENAIVTSGGVDVRQINPTTLGSKLAHGVYFAGEVLDVDAYTGGFNIQIALSTGYTAGLSAATQE